MTHKTGETVTVDFCTSSPTTAAATDADTLPAATLVKNGVDDAAAVTVTNKATGVYKAAVTLPTVTDGDELQLRVAATVGGVTGKAVVWSGAGVTRRPSEVAAAAWDEILTGATHNVPNSAGKRLRTLATNSMHDGTAQGGTANTITLDLAALATNGAYDPGLVVILSGTGAGQGRLILDYVGATRVAVVDRDWRIVPDNTSEFTIMGATTAGHVHEGVAAGATMGTLTLGEGAKPTNDIYKGQVIFIKSGTGQDQARSISTYNGATRVASVTPNWDVLPDTTSGYVLVPGLTDPTTVRSAVGLAAANLDAQLAALNATVTDKTGYALAADGLDVVMVEAGLNARQALAVIASASAGVLAGAGTEAVTIAAAGVPAATRIAAAVTEDGNRLSVVLTPPM